MRRRRYIFWMRVVRFAAKRADRTGVDWVEDDTLTRADVEARMSVLPKVEVCGRPKAVLSSTWPVTITAQTWASGVGTTYTYRLP